MPPRLIVASQNPESYGLGDTSDGIGDLVRSGEFGDSAETARDLVGIGIGMKKLLEISGDGGETVGGIGECIGGGRESSEKPRNLGSLSGEGRGVVDSVSSVAGKSKSRHHKDPVSPTDDFQIVVHNRGGIFGGEGREISGAPQSIEMEVGKQRKEGETE